MPRVGFRHSESSKKKMSDNSKIPIESRFWGYVNKRGPVHPVLKTRCWLWTASVFKNGLGYGQVHSSGGRGVVAHRVSWSLHMGEIPIGKLVLHKCDNPICVNPEHLFLGDHQANNEDMWTKGRSRVLTGEDTSQHILTEREVVDIRRLYARGKFGYKRLAKKFGVAPQTIVHVIKRNTWKHI